MDDPVTYAARTPTLSMCRNTATRIHHRHPEGAAAVVPLHTIGLGFVADLMEPALRVIIEETGYDRSIPMASRPRSG